MALKVLVVDDEKPIAEILKFNLENEGYEVVCAYDGNEAVEIAESEDPDLILLDLMLPEKDGNEVCREIRKTKNMPIIMLRSEEHTSELQSRFDLVCRLLLEKKNIYK